MSKTPTRIYRVAAIGAVHGRLVRATSQAQALRHVALDEFSVEVATQDQLVNAVAEGIKVEQATSADPA